MSRYMSWKGSIAVRVLLMLVALALLYGCGQTSSPVKTVKEPTTPETAPPTPQNTTSTWAGMSGEQAAQAEAYCRMVTYASKKDMSQQEVRAFIDQTAEQSVKEMEDDPLLSAGAAGNKFLDDLGVPRYPECRVRGE
jgi:hypothetical protein